VSDPRVSVIIPTYERAHYVGLTIDSVLVQEGPPFEVIVLDDGSTDGTWGLLEGYGTRIRAARHDNVGQSATVNRGLELARGDLSMMLSSDDLLLPGALARLVKAMDDEPGVVVAFPDYSYIDEDGRWMGDHVVRGERVVDMLAWHECLPGVGATFRTADALAVGGWDAAYRNLVDLDFWLRLGLRGAMRRVPAVLGAWRRHRGSITNSEFGRRVAREHVTIIERFFDRDDIPAELRAVEDAALRSAYITAGLCLRAVANMDDDRWALRDRLGAGGVVDSAWVGFADTAVDQVNALLSQLEQKEAKITSLVAELGERAVVTESLDAAVRGRDARIAALLERVASLEQKEAMIRSLEAELNERARVVEVLDTAVGGRDARIAALLERVASLEQKEAMIRSLAAELNERAGVIEVLDAAVRDRDERRGTSTDIVDVG